ncbi:uncharacterized protein LOC135829425 [Sycon ciliatum]|uniref:uncharacterized protein LOC135829425 n=1 Tax=Sycon ciliatum TaxID=27933 RepID=UPI0031F63F13
MMEELMRRDRIIHTLTAQCTTGQEECDRLRHEIVDLGEKGQVIPQLETRVSESDARLKRVNEEFTRQVSQAIPIREFEAALRELREVSTRQDALDIQQRERLESDVNLLRLQLERCKQPYSPDGMPSEPPGNVTPQQICDFEALLCRRECHIQQLQEDVVKWRQLYSDELNLVASTDTNGLRSYPTRSQSLADVTSDERNSSDQHRQQQQQQQQEQQRRRVEIVSADLFSANRRVVELETVVKQLRFLMTDLSKELTNVRRLRDEDERQVGRDIATAATTAAGDRENRNGGHDGGGDDERAASPDSSSSFPLSPISKNGTSFGSVEHL